MTALALGCSPAFAADTAPVAPNGDWRTDAPGLRHAVRVADLPKPGASASSSNTASIAPRPANATPRVPAGYTVSVLTAGLDNPRMIRVAPNGDVFIAETNPGRIRVVRLAGGRMQDMQIFATGLGAPFGMAFYPSGADPQWLYVANNNSVVRFAYRNGDLHARGMPETIVPQLTRTTRGHTTRDIAFTRDGRRMLVSVGSQSNVAEGMLPAQSPAALQALDNRAGPGAMWGEEEGRADILAFDPDGHRDPKAFATGIRNCVAMAVHPDTGDVWCVTNERDLLGDNLVPDYATRVREGGFYGWPWYYLGANPDPRHPNGRTDLRARIAVPDVLFQSHSAPLGITFWRGDAYVALHGSWNRATRTGYKIVRVPLRAGAPADFAGAATGPGLGVYEDFMTGFVVDDTRVWGRPVGVAATNDGALLVTDDASGIVWRVTPASGTAFAGTAPTTGAAPATGTAPAASNAARATR